MPIVRRTIIVPAILAPDALVAGPRMDQGPVHTEVLARQQAAFMRRFHHRVEQADEPTEQQVVRDLLDQLPLTSNAVQHLKQHRPHQFLRRNARPTAFDICFVDRRELGIHLRQPLVHPRLDRAQRMRLRHELLQSDCAEQGFVVALGASMLPSCLGIGLATS
ncbi:hypothetical protein NLI96_g13251 [Meripilus lineatus]|uniref:Uncharacterized protein n=1 Tax=Meripilus lineatus TaxID=2056292 RepID=A0AAD5YBN5_9APHY|nr:hypothetical protein NLI96_g13251 [Physisporinus lineatus]